MTTTDLMTSEGACWIIAVAAVAAGAAGLLWIIMQTWVCEAGRRVHLRITRANVAKVREIVFSQNNPKRRRAYVLAYRSFCACMALLITGAVLMVVLFFVSVWIGD